MTALFAVAMATGSGVLGSLGRWHECNLVIFARVPRCGWLKAEIVAAYWVGTGQVGAVRVGAARARCRMDGQVLNECRLDVYRYNHRRRNRCRLNR